MDYCCPFHAVNTYLLADLYRPNSVLTMLVQKGETKIHQVEASPEGFCQKEVLTMYIAREMVTF